MENTSGEMFCGIGGVRLGLERSGWKTVWANDIDKYACQVYRKHFGSKELIEGDIRTNEQLLQKKSSAFTEIVKRNQKIIDDSKIPAVEQLRALIVNVIEHDDLVQLHREKRDLLFSELLVNSIRMFQQEVSFELNKLHATISLQKPKAEEPERYAKIERELVDVKHVMEKEWKPLMDMLSDAIKKRDKYLEEHR